MKKKNYLILDLLKVKYHIKTKKFKNNEHNFFLKYGQFTFFTK